MNDDIEKQELEAEVEHPPEGWVQIPILRGVFEITPILDLCEKYGGAVVGGYARFCCSTREQPVRAADCDIFPIGADKGESEAVYGRLVEALKQAGLTVKHENNVSITYDAGETSFKHGPTVQLIKPIDEGAILTLGSIEDVLDNFDFTIVRVALNRDRRTATAWASFLSDEEHRKLRILNIHCPISSLLRCMKYARKGYYMRPIEAMKLFVDWQERSPEYRERIVDLFRTGKLGKLSKQEVDELESLLRVD